MPMLIKSRPIIPVLVIGILFIVYLFSHASSPGLTRITSPGTHSNVSVHTVVAQIRSENATWLYRLLPDWNHNVYVVDDPRALLTVPMNKGRESMVYLT